MSGKLAQIPESTVWPRLAKEDWLGALGVFLVVFLSLFPVVVRFIFVSNARLALRISNGVALVLLFLGGIHSGALRIASLGERAVRGHFWDCDGRHRDPPWMKLCCSLRPRRLANPPIPGLSSFFFLFFLLFISLCAFNCCE